MNRKRAPGPSRPQKGHGRRPRQSLRTAGENLSPVPVVPAHQNFLQPPLLEAGAEGFAQRAGGFESQVFSRHTPYVIFPENRRPSSAALTPMAIFFLPLLQPALSHQVYGKENTGSPLPAWSDRFPGSTNCSSAPLR